MMANENRLELDADKCSFNNERVCDGDVLLMGGHS